MTTVQTINGFQFQSDLTQEQMLSVEQNIIPCKLAGQQVETIAPFRNRIYPIMQHDDDNYAINRK